jgi:RNA polymerase sigma factor (sigma-70 family)
VELEKLDRIIEGCIRGEPKAQKEIYDRFRGFACRIVFRYIYRYEKAMDIVTDGFVKAFTAFPKFKIPEDTDVERLFMGWLKRIMINAAIDELRRNEMIPQIGGIPEEVWQISDKSQNADQMLLYKELVTLVKELPPNYGTVFNLYVIDGYTHSQVAELLKISVGTSKSCLSRARTLLLANLRKMEEEKICSI